MRLPSTVAILPGSPISPAPKCYCWSPLARQRCYFCSLRSPVKACYFGSRVAHQNGLQGADSAIGGFAVRSPAVLSYCFLLLSVHVRVHFAVKDPFCLCRSPEFGIRGSDSAIGALLCDHGPSCPIAFYSCLFMSGPISLPRTFFVCGDVAGWEVVCECGLCWTWEVSRLLASCTDVGNRSCSVLHAAVQFDPQRRVCMARFCSEVFDGCHGSRLLACDRIVKESSFQRVVRLRLFFLLLFVCFAGLFGGQRISLIAL